ncbi:hypothetical protein [Sandarakinorhabdus glacialis]|uniref:hypothetical protein n=1 Tax=Sandarakinorhabdus glacialis TaxID=1614636 RepID=UPI001A9C63C4|nr:hypothetical protein [Polymorphobacter glacialis]
MRSGAIRAVVFASACLLLSSCATQPAPADYGDMPGFWLGMIHGFLMPFSFIASFFSDVRIYAFPNNGGWYDFGFVLGVFVIGGGGAAAGR